MTKHKILPLVATAILAGAMFFAGCEKETLVNNDTQNITKCWGEDDQDGDIYYSTPDNPNVLIRVRDSNTVTVMGIQYDDALGHAFWNHDNSSFVCQDRGNNCGNCREVEGNTVVREGTYVNVRNINNEVVATYYNWHDCYEEPQPQDPEV